MLHHRQRLRFSFGLRTLLGVVLLVAVCAAWVRRESIGYLVHESEALDFGGGSRVMVEIDGAADVDAFTSLIVDELQRDARERGLDSIDICIAEFKVGKRRFLKCDFDRWAKRRLDPWRFRYVLDYDDPIAKSRNSAAVAKIHRVAALSQFSGRH